MPEDLVIISDTSCLIILESINEIDLLKNLFGRITVTRKVADEFGKPLPKWVDIVKPAESMTKALGEMIDDGEASSIALALHPDNQDKSLIILDDLRARKLAKKLDLKVIGTIGVIAKAEKKGIIERRMNIIEKIQNTNFRLSDKIINQIRNELKK